MTRFVAVAAPLLAIATTTVACVPFGCGVADDYAKGTDGQWVVTRLWNANSCSDVAYDDFEQMVITIEGDQVTVDSAGLSLASATVSQDGDRRLVTLTVNEAWSADPSIDAASPFATSVAYSFELVPATARLEGTATTAFVVSDFDCSYSGTASAGRVAE